MKDGRREFDRDGPRRNGREKEFGKDARSTGRRRTRRVVNKFKARELQTKRGAFMLNEN